MTKAGVVEAKPGERLSRARQRQKLIDACITALHQHGPSRTTIDKVVSIADMSPGIVNFYFDTKAALLVAALDHLAVEFETRVLEPVAALREKPMVALDRLIELYLDPDVATARKVSVWYSFWGESSSRREYSEICGKRDLAFAALVQDLIAKKINESRLAHLDADAVSLGLIGCLEMMWQEIAFQEEADLDRETAKKRCRAYLRSVFPGQTIPALPEASLYAADYMSEAAFRADIKMLRRTWQFACATFDLPRPGDYVAWESAIGRSVVLRGADGILRALVNTCLHRPHALFAKNAGHVDQLISCAADDSVYALDGACQSGGQLQSLLLATREDALFITQQTEAQGEPPELSLSGLLPCAQKNDRDIQADWKLVMEHWADAYFDGSKRVFAGAAPAQTQAKGSSILSASFPITEGADSFSRRTYARLHAALKTDGGCVERTLVWPNLFAESRPDGTTLRIVSPIAPGRSRICTLHYAAASENRILRALFYLATRMERTWQVEDARIIESTQGGIQWTQKASSAGGPALKTFWGWLRREEANG
jgi:TetR/AcrR family transcriptional repressor of bet genes